MMLVVPSQHYVCESSVSATGLPDVTDYNASVCVVRVMRCVHVIFIHVELGNSFPINHFRPSI